MADRYGLENEVGGALEKYPYSFRDWKTDNPNVSIRKDMAVVATNYPRVVLVTERGAMPDASDPATVRVVHGPETKTNGQWAETWQEVALTAEEQADYAYRAQLEVDTTAAKAETFIQTFVNSTLAKTLQHVEDNVTDLASAKLHLKRLTIVCLILAKQEFR